MVKFDYFRTIYASVKSCSACLSEMTDRKNICHNNANNQIWQTIKVVRGERREITETKNKKFIFRTLFIDGFFLANRDGGGWTSPRSVAVLFTFRRSEGC